MIVSPIFINGVIVLFFISYLYLSNECYLIKDIKSNVLILINPLGELINVAL